jgi:uncharacterized protein with NRDE domain
VCLLVVLSGVVPGAPLVVAANRDEFLERPAVPFTVLQEGRPRILGGRDEVAGGTWLAVNQHGVVAGLTNRPSPAGKDPTKRSRGELPLALAGEPSARAAAEAACRFDATAYNPCWLLVGDRTSLFVVDMTGSGRASVRRLARGVHVLENRPLGEPSAKVTRVHRLLRTLDVADRRRLRRTLSSVLADHVVPDEVDDEHDDSRAKEVRACCVHAGPYGTRSSTLIEVPGGAGPPSVWVAGRAPCTAPFVDVSGAWEVSGAIGAMTPGR